MAKETLYEKRRHGTSDFPVAYYSVDASHPEYFMPPHFHREIELLHVISGSLKLQIQATVYHLTAGEIFFINSGRLHQAIPENCAYECVVFHPSLLKQAPAEAEHWRISAFFSGELELKNPVTSPPIKALVCDLFAALRNKNDCYGLLTYSLLFQIFYRIMSSDDNLVPSPYLQTSEKNKALAELLEWIEEHYALPITLDQLAAHSGYNKKYLCKIFREYTGKSPIEYINELRLNAACHDIRYNGLSVTAAAFKNGFNDLSYFCRAFKRYTGITPKQYQQG